MADMFKIWSTFVKAAVEAGIISKEQGELLYKQGEGLFDLPDDPDEGFDKVDFKSAFDESSGDDKLLELDEFKSKIESGKWDSKLKELLAPLTQIFVNKDGKVDEELFKKVAGDDGKLSKEELAALDANKDGEISEDEVNIFRNKNTEPPVAPPPAEPPVTPPVTPPPAEPPVTPPVTPPPAEPPVADNKPSLESAFAIAALDDSKLTKEELKYKVDAYQTGKLSAKEKAELEPLMLLFLKADGKIDDELFDKLAGNGKFITIEQIAALDADKDDVITEAEIGTFKNPPATAKDIQNAMKNEVVKKAIEDAAKFKEIIEDKSLPAGVIDNSQVKAALASITRFNELITKLQGAKTISELNGLLSQITGMAATVADAITTIKKVTDMEKQRVKDADRQEYADPDNIDLNSILTRNSMLADDYRNDTCVTIGGKHRVDNDSYQTAETYAVEEFKRLAKADLDSFAVSLRKELKEQMGDKYNEAEANVFIQAAMEKTIKDFTSGRLIGVGGKSEGKGARGQNKLIFNDYGSGKDWNGKYEYSKRSLIDSFMNNYKAEVKNTPTKQLEDIKTKTSNDADIENKEFADYQLLQYGGRLVDENGEPITDRNGNTVNITDSKYMDDYSKKELEENLKKLNEAKQKYDDLVSKIKSATNIDDVKKLQAELSGIKTEMSNLKSNIRRRVEDAYYRFQSENNNSNYGYGNGGYNSGYDNRPSILSYY